MKYQIIVTCELGIMTFIDYAIRLFLCNNTLHVTQNYFVENLFELAQIVTLICNQKLLVTLLPQ